MMALLDRATFAAVERKRKSRAVDTAKVDRRVCWCSILSDVKRGMRPGPDAYTGGVTDGATVLVCDADSAYAQERAHALVAAGFRVTICSTAAQCQEEVSREAPALVTVPVLLPDLDGFALARWINAQGVGTRILLVSALQADQRARTAGVDAFLLKTAGVPRMVSVIRRLVGVERGRTAAREARMRGAEGGPTAALVDTIARTARAVATLDQADEALGALLAAVRTYAGASRAVLLRSEQDKLVVVLGQAGEDAERPLDEAGLVAAGGGGYPVLLGGWLEGVLVLSDVSAAQLKAHEGPLAPLLDLAAVALRDSRLLERGRRARLEREDSSLEHFGGSSSTAITARTFGLLPLQASAPEVFQRIAARYGELLDLALEQRGYKVDHHLPEAVRAVAEQLGRMNASPRDVIQLHNVALRGKTAHARSRKAQAYVDEAHVLVLELMGYLASFYRRHASPVPVGTTPEVLQGATQSAAQGAMQSATPSSAARGGTEAPQGERAVR
jgi:CheY-like chemotaxis protein